MRSGYNERQLFRERFPAVLSGKSRVRLERVPDVGAEVVLDLALTNGRPGPNAYEILAFYSLSASLPLGTKAVSAFDVNVDIEGFGMLGGSDVRANHSYQFYHDAAETWGFYNRLKTELGFDATYSLPAIVGNGVAAVEPAKAILNAAPAERQDWFVDPISASAAVERPTRRGAPQIVNEAAVLDVPRRFAIVDAYFGMRAETAADEITADADLTASHVLPETLDIVFDSLRRSA